MDDSDIGKILFINLDNYKKIIFSKGHRNPQGLLNIDNKNILSTEHGPYGGDEINKIIFGKNYGWPIASYGFLIHPQISLPENHLKKVIKFIILKNQYLVLFHRSVFHK